MSDFHPFATVIKANFDRMSKHELFTVAMSGDDVWAQYLAAFPAGTNPIFRERTEHDCSCCKNFVRNIGNVVAIVDGKMVSVWDAAGLEQPYDVVAGSLSESVKAHPVTGLFRTKEGAYGAITTVERLGDGNTRRWNHFHAAVASKHLTASPAEKKGEYASSAQVFKRGLDELSADAFQTVLDLIGNKSLYRGEEHLSAIREFQKLQQQYQELANSGDRNVFVWLNASHHAARFRNTVIGTLIQDLSAGVDLEAAVRSFETKVAPTNYKRPTALITPRMVQDAMATIKELGLEDALQRRFAKLSDMTVNNVLWADASAQSKMKGGIESLLMEAAVQQTAADAVKGAEEITIDDFMANILPKAKAMEVFVKNTQMGNFMSITAPMHASDRRLFKWDNGFAWSYDGNITDSIKERVKRAGGNVSAPLRVSLSWHNTDDLDLHVIDPHNHIYYGAKRGQYGELDVDMNCFGKLVRDAVENIVWRRPQDGVYRIAVNNFNKRETDEVGFEIEIENNGSITQLSCMQSPRNRENIEVGTLTVKAGAIIEAKFSAQMMGGGISHEKWGVKTEAFTKVNTLMHSPNYWDENAVGNKHWFFILDGCRNPESTRGIYNEFLHSAMEKHRKVFEILGDKTKCQPTNEQLSGVGFSSTKGDSVLVSIAGDKLRKVYNVVF